MSVKDGWPPKRPSLATDRDSVTRQTLRAGIRAPSSRETLSMRQGMGNVTENANSKARTQSILLRWVVYRSRL